jgi:hypothetical protein
MRTTIAIEDHLLELAKSEAAERRLTLGGLIERALQEHLMRPAPPTRFPPIRSFASAVMPGIETMSNEELLSIDLGPDEHGLYHP